jgi:hypothetical protein
MKKIFVPALASVLVLSGVQTVRAQDPAPAPAPQPAPAPAPTPAPVAEPAGPFRTDTVPQANVPCVRQVRRIPPPPSPRSFRRQWPLAAVGSIVGWFVGDRIVGPKGNPFVILSGSTLGAIAGSHVQASGEGHGNLGRSVMGGVLGALPAGAVLYMNRLDTYDEAKVMTRGVVPVLGGAVQGAVTSIVTSSSLQPTRIQIIECPHVVPAAPVP